MSIEVVLPIEKPGEALVSEAKAILFWKDGKKDIGYWNPYGGEFVDQLWRPFRPAPDWFLDIDKIKVPEEAKNGAG